MSGRWTIFSSEKTWVNGKLVGEKHKKPFFGEAVEQYLFQFEYASPLTQQLHFQELLLEYGYTFPSVRSWCILRKLVRICSSYTCGSALPPWDSTGIGVWVQKPTCLSPSRAPRAHSPLMSLRNPRWLPSDFPLLISHIPTS